MRFSRAWLSRYVDLPEDGAEIARRLTAAGLAVELVEPFGDDTVFDVEVTTNRPDAMCHLGLARELAVVFGRPLRVPNHVPGHVPDEMPATGASGPMPEVAIVDPALCSRYVARVVRGIRIGPSPEWLRRSLEAIGSRSINNVVDVTNFVLWEWGQPLHAFDLAKLRGGRIEVRAAAVGEKLTTLDGVERTLDPDIAVIADGSGAVALAGVMGGLDSEVTAETVDILLESAHFDRQAVRKGSRKLGMHTDASHRFERGADLEAAAAAAERAVALIVELAGGSAEPTVVDVRAGARRPRRGRLERGGLNRFVGADIPATAIERWLDGLGFAPQRDGHDAWTVEVPSWRYFDFEPRPTADVAAVEQVYPADLYEEMLRHYGFDPVVPTLPAIAGADLSRNPIVARRGRIQGHLAAAGYAETIQYAFIDSRDDEALPGLGDGERPVRLVNPLSERLGVLRRSLLPGLVESARFNKRRGAAAVRLFEVGRVFFAARDGELPVQPERVALVSGGRLGTPWERQVEIDFYDLKGVVESLAEAFGVEFSFRTAEQPGLWPGVTADIVRDGRVVGVIGRLADEEGYALFVAELAADALAAEPEGFLLRGGSDRPAVHAVGDLAVAAPPKVPNVAADLTLTHALAVAWAEIAAVVAERAPADLVDFGLKDRYLGKGVPEGAVNTTIFFLYNAGDRTLTQDEVNERQAGLARDLEGRFGWKG